MKKTVSLLLTVLLILSAFSLFAVNAGADEDLDPVISYGKKGWIYTKNAKTDTEYYLKICTSLTDGATSDNWLYGDFGSMYAEIDLQQTCSVTAVNVQAYNPYNHAWSVYVSTDKENYTKAAEVATTAHPAEGVTVSFEAVTARYVRVVADFYVTPQQFSFREVTVYGVEPQPAGDPNVSLNKSAFLYTKNAKTDADYIVKNLPALTDGATSDNWAYGDFGVMYAQVDLGTVYNVTAVKVQGYATIKHAWTVSVSADGETFTEAGGVSAIVHPAEGVTVNFDVVSARYVRVTADFYPTSQQFSFREVSVYGSIPPVPLYPYGGPVTVTLPDGSTTDALTNGNYTDWQSITGARGGYVTIDLGAAKPVTNVAVYAYENNSEYTVYGSPDGEAWETVGYKELNTAVYDSTTGYGSSFAADGTYRYVRVHWAASTRNDGYLTVKEIDIFNGTEEYTDVTLTNVGYVYNNNNSDDGNYGNYTFYKKADGAIVLDLGEVKDVRKVAAFTQNAYTSMLVEYSEDGSTYTRLGRNDINPAYDASTGYVFNISFSNTRYLRFTCLGSATSSFDLSEIVVYTPDAPAQEPEGLADAVVLEGGSYTVPGTNAKGETVTTLAGSVPSLTGTVDVLTVPAHVTDLAGAFDALTVGTLILKNASYDADSVAAAAESGAQIFAALNEDGTGTCADLAAAGANVRNLLEIYEGLVTETVGGVNYVKTVGAITADDLEYDQIVLTVVFEQNGSVVKEKTAVIKNVHTTLRNLATVKADVAQSADMIFVDGAYIFGASIKNVPAGAYDVTVSLSALTADAQGQTVTVIASSYTQQITF